MTTSFPTSEPSGRISPAPYGPVFTAASYALAGLSISASVFAYKAAAVVASLALIAIVWQCAKLRGMSPVRAIALVGLNPLLVIYGVGGGHNDLLMLLAMAGAIWASLAARRRASGALTMLAVGVKLTAGLMLPFAIAAAGPSPAGAVGRLRPTPLRSLLIGAVVGAHPDRGPWVRRLR